MESMGQLASFIFQYLVFSDVQYSRYGDELREKKGISTNSGGIESTPWVCQKYHTHNSAYQGKTDQPWNRHAFSKNAIVFSLEWNVISRYRPDAPGRPESEPCEDCRNLPGIPDCSEQG